MIILETLEGKTVAVSRDEIKNAEESTADSCIVYLKDGKSYLVKGSISDFLVKVTQSSKKRFLHD